MYDLNDFMGLIRKVSKILSQESKNILVLYSDDGDGLSSALILKFLLEERNISSHFICLDKVYPEILYEILGEAAYDTIIFTDLGGPIHKYITLKNRDGKYIIIIDHHSEFTDVSGEVYYLNPLLYKFDEAEVPTSSTMSYLIFKEIGRFPERWAWLALLGMGESPYSPSGLNWRAVYDGVKAGYISKTDKSYRIVYEDIHREYRRLYKDVTTISSAGYYEDTPLDLFNILRYGSGSEIKFLTEKYEERRRKAFGDLFSILEYEGLSVGNYIQWFEDYNKQFYNMGTRIFDSFVSYVSYQARLFDKNKYIIGISERNPYIPGYGYLTKDWLNIAVRVPKALGFKIDIGRSQPVSALVEAVSYTVGGLGYGYKSKGAAVIPYFEKERFIRLFDSLASEAS